MPRQDRVPPSIAPADAVSARLHRKWSSFRTALREMPGYHLRFRFSAPLEVRPTPSARTPPEAPDALSQPPGALSEGQVRQLCSGKFCKRGTLFVHSSEYPVWVIYLLSQAFTHRITRRSDNIMSPPSCLFLKKSHQRRLSGEARSPEELIHPLCLVLPIESIVDLLVTQVVPDRLTLPDQIPASPLLLPRFHGQRLYRIVGLLSRQPLVDHHQQ